MASIRNGGVHAKKVGWTTEYWPSATAAATVKITGSLKIGNHAYAHERAHADTYTYADTYMLYHARTHAHIPAFEY